MLITATEDLAERVGVAPACESMGVARSTLYYQRKPRQAPKPRPKPVRALTDGERQTVLDELHGDRFVDKSPGEVWATLLDEGRYLCSERTMYRILAKNEEVKERRNQLKHPEYAKPELLAKGPNEVWTGSITCFYKNC